MFNSLSRKGDVGGLDLPKRGGKLASGQMRRRKWSRRFVSTREDRLKWKSSSQDGNKTGVPRSC